MRDSTFHADERAVSIAVTHVLTIGITTILITGLLVGGSGLLETEKDRATKSELRTIGNRMATEMSSTYYSGEAGSSGKVVVRVSHPDYVAGDNYRVEIREGDANCDVPGQAAPMPSEEQCLVLSTSGDTDEVFVPIDPNIELQTPLPDVNGGSFYIIVEESGGTLELTLSNDPSSPSLAPMPEVQR
ncbi:hypothetical protein G9C85_00740 [Halorubellus sp. JP-L1]|uniref:DUF7266 family protein n=1 Tax=Halorubellus sp. JP-L1 TaxID=2715753 RepID=UPI00140A89CA|nr:hypothetical protein [Halorubellus sp. JP-L1]NHN40162.1 hypothetical protein [Halorubellus sp. JP-L1]